MRAAGSIRTTLLLATLGYSASGAQSPGPDRRAGFPGIIRSEFIYEAAPFASAHASTIVETRSGLVAAWFGGTSEGAPDVGIWLSRQIDGRWSAPSEAANGLQTDGRRYACWNPVLFRPADGPVMLFYKVGPSPQEWWGMVRTSRDDGRTWSPARRLPAGILGPIKNKPVQFVGGEVLSGSSTESADTPSKWRVHFERTSDLGQTWVTVEPVPSPGVHEVDAIQPSILTYPGGKLQALGRTRSERVFETWSDDGGKTWGPLALTMLPNPNSGIDAVSLRDGRQVIVYNHSTTARTPLNVAVSRDGKAWAAAAVLEDAAGEYSYPSVIESSDGLLHVVYTWNRRRIMHVVIDPAMLRTAPIVDGNWPLRGGP